MRYLSFLLLVIAVTGCLGVSVAWEDGAAEGWLVDPLSPVYYSHFEKSTGIKPVKAVRLISDEGYLDALQFSTEREAAYAEERLESLMKNENEIKEIEAAGKRATWIRGVNDSGLVYREDNYLIMIPVDTVNESDVKELMNEVLAEDGFSEIEAALNSTPGLYPAEPESSEVWSKTFGDSNFDKGTSVQQTHDGGYIVAGVTDSFADYEECIWLIKIDPLGDEEWNKTFRGAVMGSYCGYSVQQTTDGGYIITGATDYYGAGRDDVWLIKTDARGDEEWNKTFGGSDIDRGCSVQETDGGFVIAGTIQSYSAIGEDVWLIKTDRWGNEEWNRTFGGYGMDQGYYVQETRDGGLIVAGGSESYGNGCSDVWLIKTDSQGNKEWDKTFGGPYGDWGKSAQETGDGGFIIGGMTWSYGAGDYDIWLIKTDSQGDEEWNKTLGGPNDDMPSSVRTTSDDGYIIVGDTSPYGSDDHDIWLIKTDSQGDEEWNRTFGRRPDYDVGYSVQQTTDGGYIIAGYTESYATGDTRNGDLWLIKTDSEGNTDLGMRTPIDAVPEESATLIVCPSGCDYASIQGAIDAANPGDVVEVLSGTYHEIVNVTKPLTLRGLDSGEGLPLVDADEDEYPFIRSSDGVELEGLVATNYTFVVSSGTYELGGTCTFNLDSGIGGSDGDIWWEQVNGTVRRMVPEGSAKIANLGLVDFDGVTPSRLRSLSFSSTPIIGDDDESNQLVEGDVFAVVTNAGNYAKVQVLEYGYNLNIRWVTYSGSIISR